MEDEGARVAAVWVVGLSLGERGGDSVWSVTRWGTVRGLRWPSPSFPSVLLLNSSPPPAPIEQASGLERRGRGLAVRLLHQG